MNMKSIVDKYRNRELYDLSCSETIVYVFNEKYELGLEGNALKAFAPFSGGMYIEDKCGAMTGGLAVIGMLFTNNVAHDSKHIKPLTQGFIKEFEEAFASLNCDKIKETHRTETEGCNPVIYMTVDLLESFINKHRDKIVKS